MTHAETILDALAQWVPNGPGPHSNIVPLGTSGAVVTLCADACDALSSRLTDYGLASGPARAYSPAELTQRAVQVAARVTGLLEPLRLYELDATAGIALLRSATPAERGQQTLYYELTLTGLHAATLKRFAVTKAEKGRRQTSFTLTHEAIAKLTDDLSRE